MLLPMVLVLFAGFAWADGPPLYSDIDQGDTMTQPLQIALWGCGTMGQSLARALAAHADAGSAQLAALYDLSPEAASATAARYDAQVAESADALLSTPGLDGVIVALPPYLHPMAVCQAAEAGLDVFCEKPMAPRVSGCREMLAAVERTGIKLMIGQVLRSYEPYQSILRWAAEERFGIGLLPIGIGLKVDPGLFAVVVDDTEGAWGLRIDETIPGLMRRDQLTRRKGDVGDPDPFVGEHGFRHRGGRLDDLRVDRLAGQDFRNLLNAGADKVEIGRASCRERV